MNETGINMNEETLAEIERLAAKWDGNGTTKATEVRNPRICHWQHSATTFVKMEEPNDCSHHKTGTKSWEAVANILRQQVYSLAMRQGPRDDNQKAFISLMYTRSLVRSLMYLVLDTRRSSGFHELTATLSTPLWVPPHHKSVRVDHDTRPKKRTKAKRALIALQL